MKKRSSRVQGLTVLLLSLTPAYAYAHPGHELASMAAGFMHPLTGLDHMLVMLAVGLWAGKIGAGKAGSHARWQLPVTFMLIMAIGGLLGMSQLLLPGVEIGIAVSVLAMGLLVALNVSLSTLWQITLTALFALMHGFAHGAELNTYNAYAVMFGMLLATGLLHATGLLLAYLGKRSLSLQFMQLLQRSIGSVIAITGIYLIVA